MPDGDVILTRDKSSGKVHKRVVMGTGLATLEGDNLDQSGGFVIIGPASEVDEADIAESERCERCFATVGHTAATRA